MYWNMFGTNTCTVTPLKNTFIPVVPVLFATWEGNITQHNHLDTSLESYKRPADWKWILSGLGWRNQDDWTGLITASGFVNSSITHCQSARLRRLSC